MAAPSFVGAGDGWLVTTGSGQGTKTTTVGNIIIVQMLVDNTDDFPSVSSTNTENLAGTANSLTTIATVEGTSVSQHLYIGRATSTTTNVTVAVGADGVDLYCRIYEFSNVSRGKTLATVIENATSGATTSSSGATAAISDASVQTLDRNRLALNFVAINDDNAVDAFTGMTGGTWAEAVAEYALATGTDGCIQLQTASMSSAGTIDGGSYTMSATDSWVVVGFALKPHDIEHGLAQARIKTVYARYGQAQASIDASKKGFALSQVWIKQTYPISFPSTTYTKVWEWASNAESWLFTVSESIPDPIAAWTGSSGNPSGGLFIGGTTNINTSGDIVAYLTGTIGALFGVPSYLSIYRIKVNNLDSKASATIGVGSGASVNVGTITVNALTYILTGRGIYSSNSEDTYTAQSGSWINLSKSSNDTITLNLDTLLDGFDTGTTVTTSVIYDNLSISVDTETLFFSPTFAQAQAQITEGSGATTYTVYGQSQASLKGMPTVIGQSQGQIKQLYNSYGQSLSSIKKTYYGFGQSLSSIEQTYYNFAQAASRIKQTYNNFGQSQVQIKQFYTVIGQTQATLSTFNSYKVFGQSQVHIKQVSNGIAQAQSIIKQIYNVLGQSQGQIKTTYKFTAQAQAQIKLTLTVYAQSQSRIKQYYLSYAQAQTTIKTTYKYTAQSQAQVGAFSIASGQSQAKIKATSQSYAQAQGTIKTTYKVLAQAQGTITSLTVETYRSYGQAQSIISVPKFIYLVADVTTAGWVGVVI